MREKLCVALVALVVLSGIGVTFGGLPFTTVERGTVGVKIRLGRVIEENYGPGLHWKTPFIERFKTVNVQQRNAEEHSEAASNDLQEVNTDVKVLYAVNPLMVPKAYDRIGDRESIETILVEPAIMECFKAVTARYTAEELVKKRAEASRAIEDSLNVFIDRSCESEGLAGLIRLDNVAVENFRFSNEFNKAIEAKVTAEQNALRAEEEKIRTITQAEAAKESVRLASEAQALQIRNKAEAEAFEIESLSIARAEAIEREAAAVKGNCELIQLRQVETWDGVLPRFSGGDVIPFLNIDE